MSTSPDESKAVRCAIRELGDRLIPYGFKLSRSTFFIRVSGDFIEFFHLHKFRDALEFRVHCGVRAFDEKTPNAVLNGPSSDSVVSHFPNPLIPKRKYRFNFNTSPESIHRCVESMFNFCQKTGECWFREWREKHPSIGRRLSTETAHEFSLDDRIGGLTRRGTPMMGVK
jgi:hypothetical protein